MFGLAFDNCQRANELLKPLSQLNQLALRFGHNGRGFGFEAISVVSEQHGVDAVGFGVLARGLSGGARLSRVDNRHEDLGLMQREDHRTFIAAGGFADHMGADNWFELFAKFFDVSWRVFEFRLLALTIDLEGGFGDIDSDMDSGDFWFHTTDSVLTHPYKYELSGQGPGSSNGSSSEHRTGAVHAGLRTG